MITLCGNAASEQSPMGLPLPDTPPKCFLRSSSVLSKRGSASFSTNLGKLVCTWDSKSRPFQDCFNALGMFCQSGSPLFSGVGECRKKITTIVGYLNDNWKNYVNRCANWISGGNYASSSCNSAISTILSQETYTVVEEDGSLSRENITPAFISSVKPLFL